jgi:hypothetical protein
MDFCIRNWNVFNVNNFPEMTKKTHLYVWFWILLLFTSCQLNVFFKYMLLVWNLTKIFPSTINISLAKVAIATEFLLATSEI